MRLEQLRYIVEVARCGSIRKASEHLFMAQQSLSQSIKKLESEMGVTLFDRTLTGTALTKEGEALLDFAQAVLAEQDKLETRLAEIARENEEEALEGALNIYAFGVFDYYLLPHVLKIFRYKYPCVKMHTYTADYEIVNKAVEKGWPSEDVALMVLADVDNTSQYELSGKDDLSFFPLLKGQYLFYCGKNHPLAKRRKPSLEEAIVYPIVYHGISGFENGALYRILCQYGQSIPDVQVDVMPINICMDMIVTGQSIGFLNEYLYEGVKAAGLPGADQIIPVPLSISFPCVLGCMTKTVVSPTVERFVKLLFSKIS